MASIEDTKEFKRLVASPKRPTVDDVLRFIEVCYLPKNKVNLWELFDRVQFLWSQKKFR